MAHKHNRRRFRRPRSQINTTPKSLFVRNSLGPFITPSPSVTSAAIPPDVSIPRCTPRYDPPTTDTSARPRSNIPAKLWQNRYTAWQEQERARAAKLEAQQIVLFGGEPGDDVELCYRMLEFFGGLDYIS